MRTSRLIPADLSKEIRALLPLWLGSVALVWAGGLGGRFLFRAGFLAYLLGSAALGALSIGQEYTNRTFPLLLSLPVSRRRVFAIKATVLITMLLGLAALAALRLPVTPAGRELRDTSLVATLSLLSSLFLAPWLTMVCRNVIGGAIFSLQIPALLLVGSEFLALAVTGEVDSPPAESFRMQVVWTAMVVLSAIGAVSSWRLFMSLETIDGPRSEFRLPRLRGRFSSAARSRVRSQRLHPVWSLVRKELHLQQLTFVVSLLYVCGWIVTITSWRRMGRGGIEEALLLLTVIHGVVVALLSGSLASAEERHLGVLESQVLMPMPAARQWAIKAAVVIGLCVVLAIVLPAVLIWLSLGAAAVRINAGFAVVVMLLAAVGLYVSSLSNNGVKALLVSAPVALSLTVLIPLLGDVVLGLGRLIRVRSHDPFGPVLAVLISAMVFGLLIRFGLTNHRSSDRSSVRIWRQILWLSGSVAAVTLVALGVSLR